MLAGFQQLSDDFQRTVERFLALQTMVQSRASGRAHAWRKTVLSLPMPDVGVLNEGGYSRRSICVNRWRRWRFHLRMAIWTGCSA